MILLQKIIYSSVKSLANLLETFGWINISQRPAQRVFCYIQHSLVVIFITTHFCSTIIRAVHYLPEFFQMLIEDASIITEYTMVQILYHDYENLSTLIAYMDTFSQSDKNLLRKCQKKLQTITLVFLLGWILLSISVYWKISSP